MKLAFNENVKMRLFIYSVSTKLNYYNIFIDFKQVYSNYSNIH